MSSSNTHSLTVAARLNLWRQAFLLSLKTKSIWSMAVSLLGVGAAFLPALISRALSSFSNSLVALSSELNAIDQVVSAFVILVLLCILQYTYRFINNYTLAVDTMRTVKVILSRIMNCICDVEYKYIDGNYDNFSEKITFASSYAGFKAANSIQSVFLWGQYIISMIVICVELSRINIILVFAIIISSIPTAVIYTKQNDETYKQQVKWNKDGTMLNYWFNLLVDENTAQEIRQLAVFDFLKAKWRQLANKYIQSKKTLSKKHVVTNSISDFLRGTVYFIVVIITTRSIFSNPALGIGTFMAVISLTSQLQEEVISLLSKMFQFSSDLHYIEDFFSLDNLDYESEPAAAFQGSTDIRFNHVTFTYPGSDKPAISDISINIHPGETIAVVGENGSGKTTFINLLCKLYHPEKGSIEIGGQNIWDNQFSVRKSISAVFQDYARYNTTLFRNIIISNCQRTTTEQELDNLMQAMGLDTVASTLPHGLQEEIGTFSSNGRNLSGGQWQKVAICRALYRNTPIMILDEPTSSLDPLAESRLYSDFASLTEGRTTILVSHRLGITALANRIFVFDQGKIIECGSHKELMELNGHYAKMYQSQASLYQ